MTRALSIAVVLIAASGPGLPAAPGGERAPLRPAGALPWDRLAELQAATPHRAGNGAGAGGMATVNVSYAEEAAEQPLPASTETAPKPEQPAAPLRDPTEPGEALRDLVAPFRMGQPGRPGGAAGLAVPRVNLKGRIIGPSAPPAAIVELQGALVVLHEGSELTVDGPEAALGGLTLRVIQITLSEVRIEVMPLGKMIVLR